VILDNPVTAVDVLARVRAELKALPASAPPSLAEGFRRIEDGQREYRHAPLGGHLLPLKRLAHWFVASAFDRQAKVVEALLVQSRELAREVDRLRERVRALEHRREDDPGT
jgi:hypothetical protein